MRWFVLVLLPLVMLAGSACFWKLSFGPMYDPVDIYVSDQYPAPGEEIVVATSPEAATRSTDREASFFLLGSMTPYNFEATGGQFRQKNPDLGHQPTAEELAAFNDPDYDGQSIEPNWGSCYWKAPDEAGKYFLTAVRGVHRRSVKVFVQKPE
ncbi:hypothetical protein JW859_15290 [bacterium]|nr:hypothetical protein [bacterium]